MYLAAESFDPINLLNKYMRPARFVCMILVRFRYLPAAQTPEIGIDSWVNLQAQQFTDIINVLFPAMLRDNCFVLFCFMYLFSRCYFFPLIN